MYELWDTVSLNMIDTFDSAAQVERAVAETIALSGKSALDPLVLVRENEAGDSETVAEGEGIAVVARRLLAAEEAALAARRTA